jgi:23S rRNA pseudouridine1911/1915/1917 synthase
MASEARLDYDASEYRGLGPPLGPEAAQQRLDRFLAAGFPFKSRGEWKQLCERGELLVNGRPARADRRLQAGDRLAVFHPLAKEPEVDARIALLAEAAGVMAVYKPGNLPMHESGLFRRKTFTAALAAEFGAEWAPVHRLDRETSGVVLCAATPALRRRLSFDFETRAVAKTYLAIVSGAVTWQELSVDQPLFQDPAAPVPRFCCDPRGVPAQTEFRVVERAAAATLLAARPRTGRPNQIRVHAAWAGHHLLGDKIYHPDPAVYATYHREGDSPAARLLAGFPRHALHAAAIATRHPETGQSFQAESPLPSDLSALWALF